MHREKNAALPTYSSNDQKSFPFKGVKMGPKK